MSFFNYTANIKESQDYYNTLLLPKKTIYLQSFLDNKTSSGCSSVRFRVHVWGAWGRWFESSHPDLVKNKKNTSFYIAFELLHNPSHLQFSQFIGD